ncbi:MAG: hypothetical protein K0S05_1749 [Agromyces sp.]|nr:hypothetical protein [Agromyces sp.]
MSDSKDESDGRERPRREQRPGQRPQSGERGATGGRPTGDRPAKRPYSGGGEKRPYGDRDAKRPYSRDRDAKRPYSGDRDAKRPYSGDRDARRPYSGGDAKRPYSGGGEKRPYSGGGEKRSYGDRDAKRPYGDRDAKRPYSGDRDAKRPYSGGGEKRPYGDRDAKRPYSGDRDAKRPYSGGGEKRPYGGARSDDRRGGRPDAHGGRRDEQPPRETFGAADLAVRPRHDDPEIPESIEARDLEKTARAELKTLSKENADWVARHLVAASMYLDVDPELAHQHAQSAGRRAGRIAVVRETLAITAYAIGDFTLALRELRTYRRISGRNDQLPLMVDSERGVGRPDRALEVGRSVERATLPAAVQVGLAIAMSGARLDLGQPELALAELEIPQLDPDRAFSYSPALFSAYAEVLEELGREAEAADWRARADRAEEALGGPAESELVEIFEVELEEGEDEDEDAEEAVSEASVAAEASEAHTETDVIDDPGAVLEDDVAAVLAEGERLEQEPEPEPEAGTAQSDEDAPDGPVPHQD